MNYLKSFLITLSALTLAQIAGTPQDAAAGATFLVSGNSTGLAQFRKAFQQLSEKKAIKATVTQLFEPGEIESLKALGIQSIGETLKIELNSNKSQDDELKLRKLIDAFNSVNSSKITLELNDLVNPLQAEATAPKFSDPLFNRQWALLNTGKSIPLLKSDLSSTLVEGVAGEDIGLAGLPSLGLNGAPRRLVKVAVLDTGIDFSHPDLLQSVYKTESECAALELYRQCLKTKPQNECDATYAKLDTDNNGYPLDCSGWNVTAGKNATTGVFGSPLPNDDAGHGTHVSGIIAASANQIGIAGVSSYARIVPIKIVKSSPNQPIRPQSEGDSETDPEKDEQASQPGSQPTLPGSQESQLKWSSGFVDVIARGLLYALKSGAEVVNLSLAWPSMVDSTVMRTLIETAVARHVIIVASSGNDATDSRVFPCSYTGVICVASHNPDGKLSHFSNYGPFVDIAAPGLRILSTWLTTQTETTFLEVIGYEYKNGTSMASPFVAGAAAEMLSRGFSADDVKTRLLSLSRKNQNAIGNLDLKKAITETPVATFTLSKKQVFTKELFASDTEFTVTTELTNIGKEIEESSLTSNVTVEAVSVPGIEIAQSSKVAVQLSSAAPVPMLSKQKMTLTIPLKVTNFEDLESKFSLSIRIDSDSGRQVIQVPIELSRKLDTEHLPENSKSVTLPVTLSAGTEFFVIDQQSQESIRWAGYDDATQLLSFIDFENPTKSKQLKYPLGVMGAEILQAVLVDALGLGTKQLALLVRLPPPIGKKEQPFRFDFLDQNLKLISQWNIDNQVSALADNYSWAANAPDSPAPKGFSPVWLAFGGTPPSEIKKANPWELAENGGVEPETAPNYHLYRFDGEGLHTIAPPDGQRFIQLLNQSDLEKRSGIIPVLMAKGDDYHLAYQEGLLVQNRVTQRSSLKLEKFRMLFSHLQSVPVFSLDPESRETQDRSPLTVFSGSLRTGSIRMTGVSRAAASPVFAPDTTVEPISELDSAMEITAAYLSATSVPSLSFFTQTHYRLQFTEVTKTATSTLSASLERFSFLPSFIFSRSFFGTTVKTTTGTVPALYLPPLFTPYTEMWIVKDHRLTRPARLRFDPKQMGCRDILSLKGSALYFFCGQTAKEPSILQIKM